jgi:hypothetical protein
MAEWPQEDKMNRMMGALGSAVGLFIAMSLEPALAQVDEAASDLTVQEMTWPAIVPATAGILPPAEILTEVRQEGFYPVGRPVQRGRVYVLFAIDQDDMDVRLTVDGASGQVLWVTGAVARLGGPGHYGHRSVWREHPPVPPADIPAAGSRNSFGPAGTHHTSLKRFPPLPRTRPADLAGDVLPAQGSSPAAPPVTMVPVAPLE